MCAYATAVHLVDVPKTIHQCKTEKPQSGAPTAQSYRGRNQVQRLDAGISPTVVLVQAVDLALQLVELADVAEAQSRAAHVHAGRGQLLHLRGSGHS